MHFELFSILSFLFYQVPKSLAISSSECQGCSIFSTCDIEFVNNKVYGCGGIWDNDASYLCNDGYEICPSSKYASKLGLTRDLCINSKQLQQDYFYMSLETIDNDENNIFMTNDIYNEILGCANTNSDSWLFINRNGRDDNVFGAQLSIGDSDEAWKFGWYINGDEITHTYSDKSVNRNIMGGVLCCQSVTNDKNSEPIDASDQKPILTTPTPTKVSILEPSNTLKDTNNDIEDPEDDLNFDTTTTNPIQIINSTTIISPTPTPTRGLTANKCCHAYYTNRYESRCNLLTAKNVCTDSTVARRCYWNNNDCKHDDTSFSPTSSNNICHCEGNGNRKLAYCSKFNDESTCMFQNCNWKCQ